MNNPHEQSDFAALSGLVDAAVSMNAVFPYVAANAARLRQDAELFLEFAGANETKAYERILAASLKAYFASGRQLESLEQAKEYSSSIIVQDGQAPWLVSMLQSLWHLRNDLPQPPGPRELDDEVVVLVSLFNETRFCELALKSLRQYAGLAHRTILVNNSSRDISGFRHFVTEHGLVDEWFDTGATHHGVGLQRAFERVRRSRYIALVDSDAIGLKEGWLSGLKGELDSGAAIAGPIREPHKETIVGQAIHPCCMIIDQKVIGGAFQIDFRSFWPFWDVAGLLTWDCRAHGLEIAAVPHVYDTHSDTSSTLVNNSIRHLWYTSRISGMDDDAVLDGSKVGAIRSRIENDFYDPSLDALRTSAHPARVVHAEPARTTAVSVVLTTYNRLEMLRTVLDAFGRQTAARDLFEIIVVDDGSEPPAREVVESFTGCLNLRYIFQQNSGLASARNAGIKAACGSIVLFHDDDDLPDADLVAEHIRSHEQNPDEGIVVLGHLDWHPGLTVTPLMHYITHEGGQYFGYDKMVDGRTYDGWKWWGGLVSAKASLLRSVEGPFDHTFRFGHEDTELVCRLRSRRIKVFYNASARKFILRPVTLEDFCSRRVRQGRAMYHLAGKHRDVVIKRYGLDKVEEEYASQYRQNLQRWHDVLVEYEPVFNANPEPIIRGEDPSTGELQKYWALCFRGYMLKGYMEEALAAVMAQSTMTSPVTLEDTDAAVGTMASAPGKSQPVPSGTLATAQAADRGPILFICPTLPRTDVGSSNVRVHHILNILAGQGSEVELVYFGQSPDDQRYIESWGKRISIRHVTPTTLDLANHIQSSEPRPACVWMTNLWNPSFCDSMYKVADWLKKTLPDTALIVDTMDHHAAKFRRQFEHSQCDKDASIAGVFESVEARLYPLADRVVTVTEDEKSSIAQAVPGCSYSIIPNVHILREGNPGFEARRNICFIGSPKIPHNADGIKWFISEVLPSIRDHLPDVEFHILGFGSDAYRQTFEVHPGVKVIGHVPDAEAAVANYRIVVCPLVYGAGMKGKLGTAACAGTPFVTTSVGAQGFDLVNGSDCFIADRADDFAAGCMLLYINEQLWTQFAAGTRRKFASAYSPEAVAPTIERMMADLGIRPSAPSSVQPMGRTRPDRVAALLEKGRSVEFEGSSR